MGESVIVAVFVIRGYGSELRRLRHAIQRRISEREADDLGLAVSLKVTVPPCSVVPR
jgi:hypothetical protein